MKIIILLLVGVLALALQNVLLARLRLAAPVIMLGNIFIMVFATVLLTMREETRWPQDSTQWWAWIWAGCLLTVTAFCVTTAYAHGASPTRVMSVMALGPLFATMIQSCVTRSVPDRMECLAMVLSMSAIYVLVARNESAH